MKITSEDPIVEEARVRGEPISHVSKTCPPRSRTFAARPTNCAAPAAVWWRHPGAGRNGGVRRRKWLGEVGRLRASRAGLSAIRPPVFVFLRASSWVTIPADGQETISDRRYNKANHFCVE